MNERDSLMKQIMAFSFAAYDWNLYLDTHPCDKFAIKMFQSMTEKANSLKNEYIEKYGPITAADVKSEDEWTWIYNPWPWD